VERDLLERLVHGDAHLHDRLEEHMSAPLPLIGGGEPLSALLDALEGAGAVLVLEDGKPHGVVTRQDVLGFLAGSTR
jgi:cystathionine beta-synthase